MQGKDIVKGLEQCTNGICENCPYKQYKINCCENLIKDSLDFIKALQWTNKRLIKTEKVRRKKLWLKAVNQFAEKIKNGHSVESIMEEMIRQ